MDSTADHALTGAARSLRTLVRRGVLVCGALGLSVLGFLLATFNWSPPATFDKRGYDIGSATAMVLVDSPVSPVTHAGAAYGIPQLADRARLLAELTMQPVVMRSLPRRAGVAAALLVADPPGEPQAPSVAPLAAADRRAYVVSAEVPALDGGANPIIVIRTRAPTPAAAARLAAAVVAALTAHLAKVGDVHGTPRSRRIRLKALAPPDGRVLRAGPPAGLPVAAAVAAFVLGCWLLVALSRRTTRPRTAPCS